MDAIGYTFYLTLFLQFVLGFYLQDVRMEWIILSSLSITMIITSGIFLSYMGGNDTSSNTFRDQMKYILTGVSSILYKIPNMIASRGTSSVPETSLTPSIILLSMPIILTITSIAIVLNYKDTNITKDNERQIQKYKAVLMANIMLITFGIICMTNIGRIPKMVVDKTGPVLLYGTIASIFGSSIWMMYSAVEIMYQYRKDE